MESTEPKTCKCSLDWLINHQGEGHEEGCPRRPPDSEMNLLKTAQEKLNETREWLTLDETCRLLKIHKTTLHDWRRKGIIKTSKPGRGRGGYTRVHITEIERVLREAQE